MAGFMIPIFEKGCILTEDMLEKAKNYAVDYVKLSYDGYANGILSGCKVTMSGDLLYVNQGILMFENHLYFVSDTLRTKVQPGNQWQVLCFQVSNISRTQNYLIGDIQLTITTDLQDNPNRIEICRFRLQNGALLRNQYRDFNDLSTEFDTINEIYAQWSGYEKNTISNRVLREFAKEAMRKGVQNMQDLSFIQQILLLDHKSMNRDAIQFYLSSRLNRPYRQMTQIEIYDAFKEVLRNLNQTNTERSGVDTRMGRKIIVD